MSNVYLWNKCEIQVDGMSGLDFRGKTEGPVYFEIVCTCLFIHMFNAESEV